MRTIKLVLIIALFACLTATAFGGNTYEPTESRTYVEEKFVGVLIDQFGVELEKLSHDTLLREDFGADNTDLAELLMSLEEYFDITVSDAQWAGVATIESAVDLVFDTKNSSRW
jgi:acyl carrier protein